MSQENGFPRLASRGFPARINYDWALAKFVSTWAHRVRRAKLPAGWPAGLPIDLAFVPVGRTTFKFQVIKFSKLSFWCFIYFKTVFQKWFEPFWLRNPSQIRWELNKSINFVVKRWIIAIKACKTRYQWYLCLQLPKKCTFTWYSSEF